MAKNDINKVLFLIMILISVGFIAVKAYVNDSIQDTDASIFNDIQTYYIKNESNSFLIQQLNNSSLNYNKSIAIQFISKNLSRSGKICWNLSKLIAINDKSSKHNDMIDEYKISLAAKGARGDEWIDLEIYSAGNILKKIPLHLSSEWEVSNYYVYGAGITDAICLVFSSPKNPVGAKVYIGKIEIKHLSSTIPHESTQGSDLIMIKNPTNKLNLEF